MYVLYSLCAIPVTPHIHTHTHTLTLTPPPTHTHTHRMAEPSDEGDFLQAIERFTEAITLNRNNHLLFSNRSAAYSRVGKFREALEDAKRCHELKSDWPKVRGTVIDPMCSFGNYFPCYM